jgi:hypothetical protein
MLPDLNSASNAQHQVVDIAIVKSFIYVLESLVLQAFQVLRENVSNRIISVRKSASKHRCCVHIEKMAVLSTSSSSSKRRSTVFCSLTLTSRS